LINSYGSDKIAVKLLYYCNSKKEVYFKRKDVTGFLVEESPFEIPNKQGFDGNLSYFGYDIINDTDGDRILVLRGRVLNRACLNGDIEFRFSADEVEISIPDEYAGALQELDTLITNKSSEARAFRTKARLIKELELTECDFRIFANQKVYEKDDVYYAFPKLVIDPIEGTHAYEIVNHPRYLELNPFFVFPIYDSDFIETGKVLHRFEQLFYEETIGYGSEDFYFYSLVGGHPEPVDIGSFSLQVVITEISSNAYSLRDKDTSRKVLQNARLNTDSLRKLAMDRDESKCRICSIDNPDLLVCSHIKPWRDGEGRLDLDNVLMLCVFHDRLFDRGLISFNNDGSIVVSTQVDLENRMIRLLLENTEVLQIQSNTEKVCEYLDYHRTNILRG